MLHEVHDRMFIEAISNDRIDLDVAKPCRACVLNPVQYASGRIIHIINFLKGFVIQRIKTDREPSQTSLFQICSASRCQHRPIGCQADVLNAIYRINHLHKMLKIAPYQRLPSGDAHFTHSDTRKDRGNSGNFLQRQEVLSRDKGVTGAKNLPRHTVDAAEIASVRNRNPKISKRSAKRVGNHGHR